MVDAISHDGRRTVAKATVYQACDVLSMQESSTASDLRKRCREGDPFPLIGYQWPNLLIHDPDHAKYFHGEIGNPDNPCLRLDDWQRDEVIRPFFDVTYSEIAIKGNTRPGKGCSVAIAACLWFDVYEPSKVIISSATHQHAKKVLFAEMAKWRRTMREVTGGRLLTSGVSGTEQHYILVSNPLTGEGFSGQHGPSTLFVFDEACHDDKTEVMTNKGWKLFGDLDGSEYLLTMNQSERAEYLKPVSIHKSWRDGEMVHYKCKGADFCVTPNHSMIYRTPKVSHLRKKEIQQFANHSNVSFPRCITWDGEEKDIYKIPSLVGSRKTWHEKTVPMDAWCSFLGWYCSEGHVSKAKGRPYSIAITQKDGATRREIIDVIRCLGYEPSVTHAPTTPQVMIHERRLAEHVAEVCGQGSKVKHSPQFIRWLSPRQISMFLQSFARGDGYRKGSSDVYYTSSKRMADDLHTLILLTGQRARMRVRRMAGVKAQFATHEATSTCDGYVIQSSDPSEISFSGHRMQRIAYQGYVYCAHVPPNNTLLTRRNGHVLWSGNSIIPRERYEDAQKQARKIVALGNPRTLTGWFHDLWRECGFNKDTSQTVSTPSGNRRCVTIGGLDCMNVRQGRLEKPVAPVGGIEIEGQAFKENEAIPSYLYQKVAPLIPNQCDLGRFRAICQHPDVRHVDVFAHGKFPRDDPLKQVILQSYLERHVQAWREAKGVVRVNAFGFDVAASLGGDSSVLAPGSEKGCSKLHEWKHNNVVHHATTIIRIAAEEYGIDLTKGTVPVCVDVVGYGKGTADKLRELGVFVLEFNGGGKSEDPEYINLRAESYAMLGRRLNPLDVMKDSPWMLPDDSDLHEELCAPEKIHPKDDITRFKLSPKSDITASLGRSPDKADAVTYLYHAVRWCGEWGAYVSRDIVTSGEDPVEESKPLTDDEVESLEFEDLKDILQTQREDQRRGGSYQDFDEYGDDDFGL